MNGEQLDDEGPNDRDPHDLDPDDGEQADPDDGFTYFFEWEAESDDVDREDVLPDEVDSEASEGVAHEYSPLEDGSFLILGGPGAGSVVSAPPDGAAKRSTAPVPTRDDAMDGRPLLLIHRPHQGSAVIPRLLANIHARGAGNVALGTVVPITSVSPKSRQQWVASTPTASVRIVDPLGYLLDPTLIRISELENPAPDGPNDFISARGLSYAPYLGSVGAADWVAQVLDAQRTSGANLLLTSGRALNVGSPQAALDAAFDEGDLALAELDAGERLALNLTLSSRWLSDPTLREMLLAEIVEQEQFETLYIRVQWRGGRTHGQPLDGKLLEGYRELCRRAEDEERLLLLPQTGLTGWHLLALGATGFGAGLDGSHNAFWEPAGGGGGATRIERYFERQLLHTVERTTHDVLTREPDYIPCGCIYCPSLFSGAAWNHGTAGLHYLTNLGELTSGAGNATGRAGGKRGYIRRSVRAARSFAQGKPLPGPNAASHLPIWDQGL